ncbi:hypothetical protein YC2023_035219 [Brassica napus]
MLSYVVHGFVLIGGNLVVVLRSSEGDFFRGGGRKRSAELFEHDEYRGFGATVFLWEVLGFLSYNQGSPIYICKFTDLKKDENIEREIVERVEEMELRRTLMTLIESGWIRIGRKLRKQSPVYFAAIGRKLRKQSPD